MTQRKIYQSLTKEQLEFQRFQELVKYETYIMSDHVHLRDSELAKPCMVIDPVTQKEYFGRPNPKLGIFPVKSASSVSDADKTSSLLSSPSASPKPIS